jgi:hypothetical protein
MILTSAKIHEAASAWGGWNAPQLALLGVSWPPRAGWIKRLEGKAILDSTWERFLALRNLHGKRAKQAAEQFQEPRLVWLIANFNAD